MRSKCKVKKVCRSWRGVGVGVEMEGFLGFPDFFGGFLFLKMKIWARTELKHELGRSY